jgi:glyoxylase-like metal-dependent hydrolase (beta-lactamase superfamily II)
MSGSLSVSAFIGEYKAIPSQIPSWPASRQATWPATTATLVSGDRDAILIDALMTVEESKGLARWVTGSGKALRSVYVTHAHADHFFGLASIRAAFPAITAVTLDALVPAVREQTGDGYMSVWGSFFPGQIYPFPEVPEGLGASVMTIEGHDLNVLAVGQSDVTESSIVHIPELETVVAGDVVYNDMHMWLAGSDHASRLRWLDAIAAVESLHPKVIIAGHKDPSARDDNAGRVLEQSRDYIEHFDKAVANSDTDEGIVQAMLANYPDHGNPYTLWVAAQGQRTVASHEGAKDVQR